MGEIEIKTIEGGVPFAEIIADKSAVVQEVAWAARALLADVMPGITEVTWGRQKMSGYGVGPKKMSEQFCYIGTFKKHVNLGFYYGADLPDPSGLLEGTGDLLRHIKLRSVEDVNRSAVRALVVAASTHLPRLNRPDHLNQQMRI